MAVGLSLHAGDGEWGCGESSLFTLYQPAILQLTLHDARNGYGISGGDAPFDWGLWQLPDSFENRGRGYGISVDQRIVLLGLRTLRCHSLGKLLCRGRGRCWRVDLLRPFELGFRL